MENGAISGVKQRDLRKFHAIFKITLVATGVFLFSNIGYTKEQLSY